MTVWTAASCRFVRCIGVRLSGPAPGGGAVMVSTLKTHCDTVRGARRMVLVHVPELTVIRG